MLNFDIKFVFFINPNNPNNFVLWGEHTKYSESFYFLKTESVFKNKPYE